MLPVNCSIVTVCMIIRMLSYVSIRSIRLLWLNRRLLNMVLNWLINNPVLIIGNLFLVVLVLLHLVLVMLLVLVLVLVALAVSKSIPTCRKYEHTYTLYLKDPNILQD